MANNVEQFVCDSSSLADKEGYSVKCASGLLALSGASTLAIGVVTVGAAAGKLVSVAMPGECTYVKLSGTVYRGDILAIQSDSTFQASTPTDGDIVGAIALQAGVTGDLVYAQIVKAVRYEAG